MSDPAPIRVLHCVHRLDCGGTETWLMQVLSRLDRQHVAVDILVNSDKPAYYDEEARRLGAKILPCLKLTQPWRYAANFRRLLREHGPYDVVHSHLYHWSGFLLALAHREGVPVRVAHSGNAEATFPVYVPKWPHALFCRFMKRLLRAHMTHGLAVSELAGRALYAGTWETDPRCRLCPCGIDLAPYRQPPDREAARSAFGIAPGVLVIGHVGRLAAEKNHGFLLRVFEALLRRRPEACLCLAGTGELEPAIREEARRRGLDSKVLFLGNRDDVPRLLMGLFDAMAFPSRHEGLPRAVNEAQAAGLPILISDHLAPEIDLVRPLVTRLPLDAGPEAWAKALLERAARPRPLTPGEAFEMMSRSPVNIERNVAELAELYRGARRF